MYRILTENKNAVRLRGRSADSAWTIPSATAKAHGKGIAKQFDDRAG